ncbi:MAG TPA: LPS export ABC transporter permease LptG [Alphaproteobacteria bacterium]|nr:LPS export ABC transporter permease LptG [Alphaproteobacteria bacterium]
MMFLFSTLSRYIGRQFLLSFGALLLILTGVIWLFEFIEMLRRSADHEGVGLGIALQLTLLKMPETVQTLFHFAVLFSAMFTFWRLTRSQELVVARAAGVSVWQFLMPVLVAAAFVGVLKVGLLNPVASAMVGKYEQLSSSYFDGDSSLLELSGGGLWLRQRNPGGISVIFADRTDPDAIVLRDVIVFLYDEDEQYRGRIDAAMAALEDGYWAIRSAWITLGSSPPEYLEQYRLETELTIQAIQESFAAPETLSFWALPDFIKAMEATGFSTLRHRLHYNSLLSQPLLLSAMVLFAAAFSLRQTRRGGALAMVTAGIVTGFFMFVLNDLVLALGLAESIPVMLAAWTPAVVGLLIGTATLLHLEDG